MTNDESLEKIRCQFCNGFTPQYLWVDDVCPDCGEKYDYLLAQEMDEC